MNARSDPVIPAKLVLDLIEDKNPDFLNYAGHGARRVECQQVGTWEGRNHLIPVPQSAFRNPKSAITASRGPLLTPHSAFRNPHSKGPLFSLPLPSGFGMIVPSGTLLATSATNESCGPPWTG